MNSPETKSSPLKRSPIWLPLLLGLATLAAYLNGLHAPFVFDDIPSIVENPTIRSVWPPGNALTPPGEGRTVSGRPVLNLSFALNRALGDGSGGFRATNVVIHIGAGLLLYGVVRRTLAGPRLNERFVSAATPLAAVIAALWLLHPLQTASVTYVVQRAESLMGFFYWLTLYGFIRATTGCAKAWMGVAWVACVLGMATKEVMVSAPVVVVLYDRLFVSESWRDVWRTRRYFHAALAGTWLLLGWLVYDTGARGGTAGFSLGVDWVTYASTQFRVIVGYCALGFWPHPLVLDYGVEWVSRVSEVLPYAVLVAALLAGTIFAFVRAMPSALAGVVFFAVLAPTSLMPGGRQTMADHRMYLPLAAILSVAVLWSYVRLGRWVLTGWIVIAGVFAVLTFSRNRDYRTTLAIWADTVAKRPDNRWARDNLGNALIEAGRPVEALAQYEAALRIAPGDAVHHYNAGNALMHLGRMDEARACFEQAVKIDPDYLSARDALGYVLYTMRRFEEAALHFAKATHRAPESAALRYSLGSALLAAGRAGDAEVAFDAALKLQPSHIDAANNLGCLLLERGEAGQAVERFSRALEYRPDNVPALLNLGNALGHLRRFGDALVVLEKARSLAPANPDIPNIRGLVLLHLGRHEEAAGAWQEALRIAPLHVGARQNLEQLSALQLQR